MSTRHMRLAGHARVFVLTENAHTDLTTYLARARTALTHEPDADETIRDVEASIGDHLEAASSPAGGVVDADRMSAILEQLGSITPSSEDHTPSDQPRGPFWARIDEGKWLGGVCLGVATRGGFHVAWVRAIAGGILFLIAGILAPLGEGVPMLLVLAAVALGYFALLLAFPSVASVEKYRRMSGTPAAH